MTGRELLELAANAYGLEDYVWHAEGCGMVPYEGGAPAWNPLHDDGDALRLAVKLQLTVCNDHVGSGTVYCTDRVDFIYPEVSSFPYMSQDIGVVSQDYVDTRRAIVLAAAQIGKEMKWAKKNSTPGHTPTS